MYVEHNDDTKSNSDDSEAILDDGYNEYGLYVDDEDATRIIKKKQKINKDHLADLQALKDKWVEFISGGNVFDDIDVFESNYQDFDNAYNPPGSETDEYRNDERRKEKKRWAIVNPRYKKGNKRWGTFESGHVVYR